MDRGSPVFPCSLYQSSRPHRGHQRGQPRLCRPRGAEGDTPRSGFGAWGRKAKLRVPRGVRRGALQWRTRPRSPQRDSRGTSRPSRRPVVPLPGDPRGSDRRRSGVCHKAGAKAWAARASRGRDPQTGAQPERRGALNGPLKQGQQQSPPVHQARRTSSNTYMCMHVCAAEEGLQCGDVEAWAEPGAALGQATPPRYPPAGPSRRPRRDAQHHPRPPGCTGAGTRLPKPRHARRKPFKITFLKYRGTRRAQN